jgi:Sec-independent protein translocase protein TatA
MSFSHLIILGIIALIVIPPEKLPELARQLAKMIYDLKRSADQVMNELKQDALFKPEDVIDKNIKDKFADIKRGLNQDLNQINQGLQIRPVPPPKIPKPFMHNHHHMRPHVHAPPLTQPPQQPPATAVETVLTKPQTEDDASSQEQQDSKKKS